MYEKGDVIQVVPLSLSHLSGNPPEVVVWRVIDPATGWLIEVHREIGEIITIGAMIWVEITDTTNFTATARVPEIWVFQGASGKPVPGDRG